MKQLAPLLLGLAFGLLLNLTLSASSPEPFQQRGMLQSGTTIYGLNLVSGTGQPLKGLDAPGAVSIRAVDGDWIKIDFATMKTGPIWVNVDNIVSYRTSR